MRENNIDSSNANYIQSLYIPTTWKPPEAPVVIENAITNFSESLQKNIKTNTTRARINLTKLQYSCLHSIKNNNQLIVCPSDKNLWPIIMDRAEYFQRYLYKHLLYPHTYVRLTGEEALQKVRNTRCTLNQVRLNNRTKLTETENNNKLKDH